MSHSIRLASLFVTILFALAAVAQVPAPPTITISHRTSKQPSPARSAVPGTPAPSAFEGIFEPVNYGQEINLTDVFFVSPEVGWVSGDHATILKTTDGGNTWVPQIGGQANNNEKPIEQLRFLDERRGWAIADGPCLLRTLDGQNWNQVNGELPRGTQVIDYTFTSVRHGILLASNNGGMYVTNDGGRHWQNTALCQFTANAQGLTRTFECHVMKLQMLSSRTGYVLAQWSHPDEPNATAIVMFVTNDAGEHWTAIPPTLRDCCGPEAFFTDLNHGVVLYNNGKTYLTEDGGRNWRVLLSGSVGLTSGGQTPPMRFADPTVGWVVGESPDNSDSYRVSYSIDGGQHWTMSRNIPFPGGRGTNLKFTFPRRDHAYVIGPHGMIYRYRIVPTTTYVGIKGLPAPLMPAFGAVELSAKADAIRRDIEQLRAKLPQPSAGSATTEVSGAPAGGNSGFTQSSDLSGQDAAAGFVQDSSPASAALGDCCSADLQQLQSDTAGFVSQVPTVTSQYRPLNLVVAGVQLATNLLNQGQNLWKQFRAFKHAPNATAASLALQQLSTSLDTVQQTSSTGFQNPGGWFAANAPADFTQDVGPSSSMSSGPSFTGNSNMDASAAQNGTSAGAALQPNAAPTAANAQNSVNQGLDKAKKVKDTLRGWVH